jgi:spore coat protein U-like protein
MNTWIKRTMGLVTVAGAALALAPTAQANNAFTGQTFTVTATVGANCLATGFGNLAVTYQNGQGTDAYSTGTTSTVTCNGYGNPDANANLTFTSVNGKYVLEPATPGNPWSLNYQLCNDNTCTTQYTAGGYGANYAVPNLNGNGTTTIPLFLKVPAGQPVISDTYTDTITASLTF